MNGDGLRPKVPRRGLQISGASKAVTDILERIRKPPCHIA
jgi:hypothetical protein